LAAGGSALVSRARWPGISGSRWKRPAACSSSSARCCRPGPTCFRPISTRDQNPDAQHDALTAAGCEQILTDKASGKLARRPELDKALLVACRRGDQLVVTKLDRLGRSLEHLIDLSAELQQRGVDLVVLDQDIDTSTTVGRMFFHIIGAIAGFEHALMSERTLDGLAAARARGNTSGQKPKLTPHQARIARQMYEETAPAAGASTPLPRSPPSSASPADHLPPPRQTARHR
jgi:DNA invertase Pin-like site-specific DNA recombinase